MAYLQPYKTLHRCLKLHSRLHIFAHPASVAVLILTHTISVLPLLETSVVCYSLLIPAVPASEPPCPPPASLAYPLSFLIPCVAAPAWFLIISFLAHSTPSSVVSLAVSSDTLNSSSLHKIFNGHHFACWIVFIILICSRLCGSILISLRSSFEILSTRIINRELSILPAYTACYAVSTIE